MLIHAVAVGGAVVAGQRPSGVLQCLSGTVSDVLQDIAGVVQQAAIGAGAVVGSVMIGPIIVGTVVDASVAIVGSRGAVVSGGVIAGGGAAVLVVIVPVVPSAGGQGSDQQQGHQQKCKASFQSLSSFAR